MQGSRSTSNMRMHFTLTRRRPSSRDLVLLAALAVAVGCDVSKHSGATFVMDDWTNAHPPVVWDAIKAALAVPPGTATHIRGDGVELVTKQGGKAVIVTVYWLEKDELTQVSYAEDWNDGDAEAKQVRSAVEDELKRRGIELKSLSPTDGR